MYFFKALFLLLNSLSRTGNNSKAHFSNCNLLIKLKESSKARVTSGFKLVYLVLITVIPISKPNCKPEIALDTVQHVTICGLKQPLLTLKDSFFL